MTFPPQAAPRRREARRNLILLCLCYVFYTSGSGQIAFLQPLYLRLRGADPVGVGAALSVQYAVQLLSLIPSGYLSDRFQRKWLLVGSWALAAAGILLMAATHSLGGLIAGMVVFGAASFGNAPTSHYLAEMDREQAVWSFAAVTTAGRIGTVISPALGAYLTQHVSLQASYLVSGLLAVISTTFLFGLTKQPVSGARPLAETFRLVASDRTLVALALPLLGLYLAGGLANSFASNFLRDVAHLDVATVGRLGSVVAVGSAVFAISAGRLTRRPGRLGTMMGICLASAAIGSLSIVGLASLPLAAGLAALLFGVAFFLRGAEVSSRTLVNAHLAQSLRRENISTGFAVAGVLMGLANIVAPSAAGWLYGHNPIWPYLTALTILTVAGGTLVRLVRRAPAAAAQGP